MAILSTYEQSWAKFIFCVVITVIFSAFNFYCYLVPFRFMVRGSWPVSGHPRPRSLCHGPRTRMPTDESRASNQRSSTCSRRWFSRRAGPRHRHRRAFSWRVETRPRKELKLGLVIAEFFCLLDSQPCVKYSSALNVCTSLPQIHVFYWIMLWILRKVISRYIRFKGTVSRDFLLLVFFLNQFPPSLWLYH
jgi:hypothetical protein